MPVPNDLTIREMVIFTRQVFNLTQREYAQDVGTNQTTVSFMERGFVPNTKSNLISAIIEYFEQAVNEVNKKYETLA